MKYLSTKVKKQSDFKKVYGKRVKKIKFEILLSEFEATELINGGGYWLEEEEIERLKRKMELLTNYPLTKWLFLLTK
jgi:hypothetical protein